MGGIGGGVGGRGRGAGSMGLLKNLVTLTDLYSYYSTVKGLYAASIPRGASMTHAADPPPFSLEQLV